MMQMTPVGFSNRVAFTAIQKPTFGNTQAIVSGYVVDDFLQEQPPKLSDLLQSVHTFLGETGQRNIFGVIDINDSQSVTRHLGMNSAQFRSLLADKYLAIEERREPPGAYDQTGADTEGRVYAQTLSFTRKGQDALQKVIKHEGVKALS